MSSWFRSTPESEEMLEQERLVVAATEAIAEAMERRGVKKKQLADLLDVRPSEISQRLSGQRNLTLKSLASMLHALGVRARISIEDESERFVAQDPWTGTNIKSQRTDIGPVISQFVVNVGASSRWLPSGWPAATGVEQIGGPPIALTSGAVPALMGMYSQPHIDSAGTEIGVSLPGVVVE